MAYGNQYDDRSRRDRYQRSSGQAEQLQSDYGYDDDRSSGQMGESWRNQEGQRDNSWQGDDRYDRGRNQQGSGFPRGYGSDFGQDFGSRAGSGYGSSDYGRSGASRSSYGDDYQNRFQTGRGQRDRSMGGAGTFDGPSWDTQRGAGSQLARSHGEWHDRDRDYGRERSYGRSASYDRDDDRGFLERAGEKIAGWFGDDEDYRRDRAIGERGGQSYRGHGPSGYKRSDERILEDANEHLTHDHRVDARNIQVTVKDGELTLNGTVTSRDQKRRAEDCVENLSGVKHVQNNLRVQESSTWDRNNSGDRASGFGGSTGTSAADSSNSGTGTSGTTRA